MMATRACCCPILVFSSEKCVAETGWLLIILYESVGGCSDSSMANRPDLLRPTLISTHADYFRHFTRTVWRKELNAFDARGTDCHSFIPAVLVPHLRQLSFG